MLNIVVTCGCKHTSKIDTTRAHVFRIDNQSELLLFSFRKSYGLLIESKVNVFWRQDHSLQYVSLGQKKYAVGTLAYWNILVLVCIVKVISTTTGSARRTKCMSQIQFGFKDVVDTWLWAPPTPTESCELASHQYVYITIFLLVGIYSMGLKPENRFHSFRNVYFSRMWVCHNMYCTNYVGGSFSSWLALYSTDVIIDDQQWKLLINHYQFTGLVLNHFLLICYMNIVHIMDITHTQSLELAINSCQCCLL